MIVRRIGPLSFAKITGALYAIVGMVLGLVFGVGAMVGAIREDAGGLMGTFSGLAVAVALPIVYGVLGFVSSLIGAALYNWLAGYIGGIELDVQ